jgi:hypothetical protein
MTTQNTRPDYKRPQTYRELAKAWLDDLRHDRDDPEADDVSFRVTHLTLMGPADRQWLFLRLCLEEADEDQLGHVAAGPFECLMGRYGADYIDQIEAVAASDPRVQRMVRLSWRYTMTDEVWARVQAIQARADSS